MLPPKKNLGIGDTQRTGGEHMEDVSRCFAIVLHLVIPLVVTSTSEAPRSDKHEHDTPLHQRRSHASLIQQL